MITATPSEIWLRLVSTANAVIVPLVAAMKTLNAAIIPKTRTTPLRVPNPATSNTAMTSPAKARTVIGSPM
ncbi:hypothetical protein AB0N05_08605 [Nocardia sp. NPDC051030]|uniref:hypothetical protein n=1 Tax=Nocardia sp. NPDC051030 TaxID=3155162 RepID=UPI0034133BE5